MEPRRRPSIEEYALIVAHAASSRSEDPWIQVGACAIRFDKSIASTGYNGPPPGVQIDWSNRDLRREEVIHAEKNCLDYCRPGEVMILATTISPCPDCLLAIAKYRIAKVVYSSVYDRGEKSFDRAIKYGIELVQLDVRPWLQALGTY